MKKKCLISLGRELKSSCESQPTSLLVVKIEDRFTNWWKIIYITIIYLSSVRLLDQSISQLVTCLYKNLCFSKYLFSSPSLHSFFFSVIITCIPLFAQHIFTSKGSQLFFFFFCRDSFCAIKWCFHIKKNFFLPCNFCLHLKRLHRFNLKETQKRAFRSS